MVNINSTKTTNLILIGMVVFAIAGVGYYFWHKSNVEKKDEALVELEQPENPA